MTLEGTGRISLKSQMQEICSVKPEVDLFRSPKELDGTSAPDVHREFNLFFSSWKDFFVPLPNLFTELLVECAGFSAWYFPFFGNTLRSLKAVYCWCCS